MSPLDASQDLAVIYFYVEIDYICLLSERKTLSVSYTLQPNPTSETQDRYAVLGMEGVSKVLGMEGVSKVLGMEGVSKS